jgi:HD superfamily phosphohydrolase
MLNARPWGIDPRLELLVPSKVVTDPIHGDVYLNRLELLVVNSRPFQRLRRVRQLGMTPAVYPGATNTRFAHSLGVLRAAQDLLDVVLDQRHDPHGVPDLFAEWESAAETEDEFPRKVGEVVIAARLGALLHDLAHVPYGHSIEDDLGILPAHDKGPHRFDYLWGQLREDLRVRLTEEEFAAAATLVDGELAAELRPLILSKETVSDGARIDAHDVMRYPFVADLVGNTICADLIDYLPRDHLYSGLPMALGHRFLDAFFVTGTDRTRLASRMALSIVRENRERTDIVTELLKYLRYRYELTERVLVHHAKLSADAMVGKALELWFEEIHDQVKAQMNTNEGAAADRSPAPATGLADAEPPGAHGQDPGLARASVDTVMPEQPNSGSTRAGPAGPLDDTPGEDARSRTSKRIQQRILLHGDDGLLEHLRDWTQQRQAVPTATANPERLEALGRLVDGLLHRDLFSLAGRSSTQQASAESIYRLHREAANRRALEEDAAAFAGIADPWKLCLWLPPPSPRLKSAEVLVFDGSEVVEFYRSEQYKAKRGEDIYEAHGRLWAVSLYIHRSVPQAQARRALVRLAQRMEVRWDREVDSLGRQVLQWPDRLAAMEVCDARGLGRRENELLALAREQKVARGPDDVATYEALRAAYGALADGLGDSASKPV